MRKFNTDRKVKQELDIQKKVNHPNKELKRINDLLAITMVNQVMHQKNVGGLVKLNPMENATIAISMVIELMNAKKNLILKENITNARSMGTNLLNTKLRY